jgi:hypothetical protein
MHLDLGDVPTWVASIGTVFTLAFALVQIRTERNRRITQEAADRQEQRLAQARLVSAVTGPEVAGDDPTERGKTAVDLRNSSLEPVYGIVVGIMFIQGAGPRKIEDELQRIKNDSSMPFAITTAAILPSGTHRVFLRGTGWGRGMGGRPGAEVAFTDRAGVHWIRRATGKLEEIPTEPFEYFKEWGLYGPYELQSPERISG